MGIQSCQYCQLCVFVKNPNLIGFILRGLHSFDCHKDFDLSSIDQTMPEKIPPIFSDFVPNGSSALKSSINLEQVLFTEFPSFVFLRNYTKLAIFVFQFSVFFTCIASILFLYKK